MNEAAIKISVLPAPEADKSQTKAETVEQAALKASVSLGPVHSCAVVLAVEGEFWLLETEGQSLRAQLAASCPLRPEQGDEVALISTRDGRLFIIAVLNRATSSPQLWSVPEGLNLEAGPSAQILSRESLQLCSHNLRAGAVEMDLQTKDLNLSGETVNLAAKAFKLLGRSLFASLASLTQHLGHCSRLVEGRDELMAETVLSQARAEHICQGRQVAVSAGESVRIDGKQINLA